MSLRSQLGVLYRVFLLRVIDLEALSPDGDTAKLLGQFAAIFAGISFLFALPLLIFGGGRPPDPFLWTSEHLLIATTITVVGLFSVLSWDSLIPDRLDVLVLGPLPIRLTTLFMAKLAAMGAALGLVIAALNIFTGLTWPILFSPTPGAISGIRSIAAYWVTMAVAGICTFCLVLIVQGIAMQLLSRQLYLRLSALFQVVIVCFLVGLYFLEPTLESREALTSPANRTLLNCLPAYWFLGLFQQLNGSISPDFASPGFAPLAERAWIALAISVGAATCVLLVAYFRTLPKLVEQPDILPSPRRSAWWPAHGKPTRIAILSFIIRSLFRSRQHRLISCFYVGVGGAAVLAYMRISLGDAGIIRGLKAVEMREVVLSTSLLLMCVAVASVRIVFSMPISLRANWIFRMTELHRMPEYVASVRSALLLISVAPIWLILAVVLFSIWSTRLAMEHLLVLALFGGCLVELSLIRFQKVPFTCSYLPGRANVHIAFWVSVILTVPIANQAAHVEWRLLERPLGCVFILLLLGLMWWITRRRTTARAIAAERLTFEELPTPELFSLKLDRS